MMKNGALSILDALADRLGAGATLAQQAQNQQQLQLQKEQQARCDNTLIVGGGGGGDDGSDRSAALSGGRDFIRFDEICLI